MRRRIASAVVPVVLAIASVVTPASAQLPGVTTFEPELIDPGAEPRRPLRYDFVEGRSETMVTDLMTVVSVEFDDGPIEPYVTDESSEVELTITDVDEDGSARIEVVVTRVHLEPDDPTLVKALVGATAWQVVDDRGNVLEFEWDIPDALPTELRQVFMEAPVRVPLFPVEPVGIGARWLVAHTMAYGELPVTVSTESEIVELDDDAVTLDVMVSISPDADEVDALQGQLETDISFDGDGSGRGRTVIDFASVVPDQGLSTDASFSMSIVYNDERAAFVSGADYKTVLTVHSVE